MFTKFVPNQSYTTPNDIMRNISSHKITLCVNILKRNINNNYGAKHHFSCGIIQVKNKHVNCVNIIKVQ